MNKRSHLGDSFRSDCHTLAGQGGDAVFEALEDVKATVEAGLIHEIPVVIKRHADSYDEPGGWYARPEGEICWEKDFDIIYSHGRGEVLCLVVNMLFSAKDVDAAIGMIKWQARNLVP
ncbi:MAG TPA: hypothetical protein VEF76_03515 [Patescibacteria group bacterium]|nr:hypothetical protein [Patescibacteria group bacterium]